MLSSLWQQILEKFEFFPVKCKVLRARENHAMYRKDLENQVGFWGNMKKPKIKARGESRRGREGGKGFQGESPHDIWHRQRTQLLGEGIL